MARLFGSAHAAKVTSAQAVVRTIGRVPGDTSVKEVAGAIKARWICEQAHQQLKEELGLDHFEGRSWTALNRHA